MAIQEAITTDPIVVYPIGLIQTILKSTPQTYSLQTNTSGRILMEMAMETMYLTQVEMPVLNGLGTLLSTAMAAQTAMEMAIPILEPMMEKCGMLKMVLMYT
jgi:hypothetical protein